LVAAKFRLDATGVRVASGRAVRWKALAIVLVPTLAHAEYADGEVPAAMNAFTQPRHALHLSLLGTSSFGITDHTEIATYVLGDALLFPNLRLEHRFNDDGPILVSMMGGVGAGAYPVAAGGVLPLPGGVFAAGGAGLVFGSIQTGTVIATVRVTRAVSVSVNAGGFAMEGGVVGVVGGIAGGGGTAGAGSATTHMTGEMAGFELAATLGKHDAIIVAADGWFFAPLEMDGTNGMLYTRATWTHTWKHFELTTGVYALPDLPHFTSVREAKLPVSPFGNVAWTWQ
jgi:hypothetical protein